MESIDLLQLKKAFMKGASFIIEAETSLSALDGYIGDGDHGMTAARGFRAVAAVLSKPVSLSVTDLFSLTGSTLAASMGGAIGPIFGSIFTGAASAFEGDHFTLSDFADGMGNGLSLVKKIGGASEGDHTLIDALSPYCKSLKESLTNGLSFKEAAALAAAAAEEGAESTKNMRASKGRARFLGDKSIGYRDAGASSFTLFAAGFAAAFEEA